MKQFLIAEMNAKLKMTMDAFDYPVIDSWILSATAPELVLADHEHYNGMMQFAKAQVLLNALLKTPYLEML
jgi:hypothetical protein